MYGAIPRHISGEFTHCMVELMPDTSPLFQAVSLPEFLEEVQVMVCRF